MAGDAEPEVFEEGPDVAPVPLLPLFGEVFAPETLPSLVTNVPEPTVLPPE